MTHLRTHTVIQCCTYRSHQIRLHFVWIYSIATLTQANVHSQTMFPPPPQPSSWATLLSSQEFACNLIHILVFSLGILASTVMPTTWKCCQCNATLIKFNSLCVVEPSVTIILKSPMELFSVVYEMECQCDLTLHKIPVWILTSDVIAVYCCCSHGLRNV